MRSLWHLSRHLTARADDNHAAPSQRPRRASLSPNPSSAIQARVRFLAYHRIKPHVPPLVRAPVNSFEFHRCRRTPQVEYLTLSLYHSEVALRTVSIHRLLRGLPGYLILFAPHAFAPHRQLSSSNPPSPLVFLLISTHFTATLGIPIASPILKKSSFKCSSRVEPVDFTSDLPSRLHALYTQ